MTDLKKRKLFIVFNKAISKARKSPDYMKIKQRLFLALGIIQSHNYFINEKALYHPTYYTCGCKDWEWRHSAKRDYHGQCKHQIAEILLDRMSRVIYRQSDFFKVCGG